MPSPETILSMAATSANEYRTLAVVWHLCLGLLIAAFALGLRPSNRAAGNLLAAPVLSVSAVAWASGNPFNGTAFFVLSLMLFGVASRLSTEPIGSAWSRVLVAGVILLAFGSTYPHFLAANHWTAYIYAAPFGLLPCPTLSAVIGLTLLSGLWRSKSWSLTMAAAGVAYGAIGVFALGVALDYGLLGGALLLAIVASSSRLSAGVETPRSRRPASAPAPRVPLAANPRTP